MKHCNYCGNELGTLKYCRYCVEFKIQRMEFTIGTYEQQLRTYRGMLKQMRAFNAREKKKIVKTTGGMTR